MVSNQNTLVRNIHHKLLIAVIVKSASMFCHHFAVDTFYCFEQNSLFLFISLLISTK